MSRHALPSRRSFIEGAACWLAAAATPTTAATAAAPATAASPEARRLAHIDRLGPVAVRLRVPATPPPWPLVVYSHGLGGHLDSGRRWTEAWSAAGYLCVHVLHAATSAAIFDAASAEATHRNVSAALARDHTPSRCAEIGAVLDALLAPSASEFAGLAEAGFVAVAGHSYGALTAMALAGRRLAPPLHDRRITAAIALSPGVHPIGRGASMAGVTCPMLCVTGSLDEHVDIGLAPRRVRAGVPLVQRLAVYRGLPAARRRLVFLRGADHMSFAGEPVDPRFFGRAASWDAREAAAHEAAVIEHTGAFLQRVRAGAAGGRPAEDWAASRSDFPGGFVVTGLDVAAMK